MPHWFNSFRGRPARLSLVVIVCMIPVLLAPECIPTTTTTSWPSTSPVGDTGTSPPQGCGDCELIDLEFAECGHLERAPEGAECDSTECLRSVILTASCGQDANVPDMEKGADCSMMADQSLPGATLTVYETFEDCVTWHVSPAKVDWNYVGTFAIPSPFASMGQCEIVPIRTACEIIEIPCNDTTGNQVGTPEERWVRFYCE